MKKKILTLLAVLLAVSLITLSFVGCSKPAEEETPTSPFNQLQSQVNSLSAKVSGLETTINSIDTPTNLVGRITTLEGQVTELQAGVLALENSIDNLGNNINQETIDAILVDIAELSDRIDTTNDNTDANTTNIETLHTDYTILSGLLSDMQAQIDALPEPTDCDCPEYSTDIIALQADMDAVKTTLTTIAGQIAVLQTANTDIAADINGIETSLDDVISEVYALKLQSGNWNSVYNSWISTPRVVISEYITSSNHLKFKTIVGGNYVVILTLYGSGLNGMSINTSVLEFQGVQLVSWNSYGAGNTMAVVVLQPKPITTTAGTTYPNWNTNQETQIDFGMSIDYASVTTGTR